MLHALIMAGGAGTRFWPVSRADRPKQLISLAGGPTMLQATVARLGDLTAPENLLVITNERLVPLTRSQLPQAPPQTVIGEPCKRDTAPCVGLAAVVALHRDPEAILVVLPADHLIEPEESFREAIRQAVHLVEEEPQRLVTFGVRPTYPAETFGYIERGAPLAAPSAAFRVVRFHEKPQGETARRYCQDGNFYWNSGIFVWRAQTILDALARFEPQMHRRITAIGDALGRDDFDAVFRREFEAIQGKSIDYAVLERDEHVVVMEAPFAWDDVGNWQAVARRMGRDAQGNTIDAARCLAIDTSGTIVRAEGDHLVVAVGLNDCIIVHTPEATLVARKDAEEAIRKIVPLLNERGWSEYL